MARAEIERTVTLSIVDRLVDEEPGSRHDPPMTLAESVRVLKAALKRDLEWLLNARRVAEPVPEHLEEVRHSAYYYGLPDITSLSRDSSESRSWLIRHVEEAVAIFEPRLAGAHVALVETQGEQFRRELHFLIQGTLRMDPTPERVVFDTVLQVSSGSYEVRGDADRSSGGAPAVGGR